MKKLFWKAIGELSDVQRKRLLLYYDYGFSLKEIAFIENCPIHVIEYSIDIAKKKLEEKIKSFKFRLQKQVSNVETDEGIFFSPFITIYQGDWQSHSYVSLCGVSEQAMLKMLGISPHIDYVVLCLDHDKSGI